MSKVREYGCYDYNDEWYLIEMVIEENAADILLDDITVPEEGIRDDDGQVPYLEQYLNEDGTELICELYDEPENDLDISRIAFFIYKTDGKILKTPYGDFELTEGIEVPERLQGVVEFEDED